MKELKLVTTDANDGDRNDHADWAAPRLLTGSQLNKALAVERQQARRKHQRRTQ